MYTICHAAIGRASNHQTADTQHQRVGAPLRAGTNSFCKNQL